MSDTMETNQLLSYEHIDFPTAKCFNEKLNLILEKDQTVTLQVEKLLKDLKVEMDHALTLEKCGVTFQGQLILGLKGLKPTQLQRFQKQKEKFENDVVAYLSDKGFKVDFKFKREGPVSAERIIQYKNSNSVCDMELLYKLEINF